MFGLTSCSPVCSGRDSCGFRSEAAQQSMVAANFLCVGRVGYSLAVSGLCQGNDRCGVWHINLPGATIVGISARFSGFAVLSLWFQSFLLVDMAWSKGPTGSLEHPSCAQYCINHDISAADVADRIRNR